MTGRPFAVTDTSVSSNIYNSNGTGASGASDRPNLYGNINAKGVVDPITGFTTGTAKEWFNIHLINYNASGAQARLAGHLGNAAPNAGIGPGWNQLDATVARTFSIKEAVKAQVRVEAFNVANHPNYQSPSGAFTGSFTGGFGSIASANSMREIQGSVRFTF